MRLLALFLFALPAFGATLDASKIVSTDAARHLVSYAGTTPCSSQAMTALSADGVATCTSVDVSWLTGGQDLTRVDDTNVTLTLGGTPTGALLKPVSLTLGWTGTLGLARGGTAANLSATGGAGQVLKQSTLGGAVTVATLAASEIASGAAITKGDDTNVTLTLGGSPTTALLSAASITAGWTGQLSPARGGTGINGAVTGLLLGNGATYTAYAGTSCTNQFPRSLNASGAATCASVANDDLAGSIAASKLIGTDIATVGTITSGTWNGSIITSAYGGTGNGFTKFSGPATSEKTFTLPNATATILTSNAAVTTAQGGTGQSTTATSGRYLKGDGSNWGTSSGSASGTGACGANTFASTLNSDASPTCTQPSASNLSDGTTGSGAVVLATSPALVTPTLGVASATSINFGGNSLSTYVEGTWTPSVGGTATYTIQNGNYVRVGNVVCVVMDLQINAIGTGSATTISGLPVNANATYAAPLTVGYFTALTHNVVLIHGRIASSNTIQFDTLAAAATGVTFADNVIGSGTRFVMSGCYLT